jgi:hypothetical protein
MTHKGPQQVYDDYKKVALELRTAEDQLDKLKVIFRGSRHRHHTQSYLKAEIPAAQIEILTDIDMQRVEQALKEPP